MILLRLVPLILLRVVLQLDSILAGNHDFAAHSPIDFAAWSLPIIFTVQTKRSKINYAQPKPAPNCNFMTELYPKFQNNVEKDLVFNIRKYPLE